MKFRHGTLPNFFISKGGPGARPPKYASAAQSTARVHPVHAMNAETAPVAADLWTRPIDLSQKLACRA